MNTAKFRSKRVIVTTLATVAAVAAIAVGGVVWTSAASADVQGADRDRIAAAAVKAVGAGTAVDVETSDDAGEAYEVEVRKDDGTEVDVALDKDLNVVTQQAGTDDDADGTDAGDRVLTDAERTSAEQAARTAITGGTVLQVEAGDDGAAYEVEVRDANNAEWDVELDAAFKVLTKTEDN
jgi:uncharacterized membrane protein YkoI